MFRMYVAIPVLLIMITSPLSSRSLAVMEGMSTADLTRASDVILEGEVVFVSSDWSEDGKTIFTKAIILESSIIKGTITQRKINVEYEGGEVGDVGLRVSDVSPLKEGERVILFLKRGQSKKRGSAFNIVGKGQGKYVIGDDGIARKRGFAVISGEEVIDNNIPVGDLIDKIRSAE